MYIVYIYMYVYRETRTSLKKTSLCCLGSRSAFANDT